MDKFLDFVFYGLCVVFCSVVVVLLTYLIADALIMSGF